MGKITIEVAWNNGANNKNNNDCKGLSLSKYINDNKNKAIETDCRIAVIFINKQLGSK